ncbi:MAG: ETC complex I subunit [Maricaulaceae bacterium]
MLARIYQPSKTAMQSGRAKTKDWVLEFAPESARRPDPLMGWTSSTDMRGQIRLRFPSREEAVAYAKRHGVPHRVIDPKPQRRISKTYAANFAFDRKQAWTH